MTIGTLRYDQVAFKGSHNSYEKRHSIPEQLDDHRVRGIELDIVQADRGDGRNWCVKHGGGFDASEPSLPDHLADLLVWSDAHPGHDVVTVLLDVKNMPDPDNFPVALDWCLGTHFDLDRVFKPGALMADGASLAASLRAGRTAWPTLDALRGRFIFCLSGSATAKNRYVTHRPEERVCFADMQVAFPDSLGQLARDGQFIFMNVWAGTGQPWEDTLRWVRSLPGFVTRVFGLTSGARLRHARAAHATMVTVDDYHEGWTDLDPAGGAFATR